MGVAVVGTAVGTGEGRGVGARDGLAVGATVGGAVGSEVGAIVGLIVGELEETDTTRELVVTSEPMLLDKVDENVVDASDVDAVDDTVL